MRRVLNQGKITFDEGPNEASIFEYAKKVFGPELSDSEVAEKIWKEADWMIASLAFTVHVSAPTQTYLHWRKKGRGNFFSVYFDKDTLYTPSYFYSAKADESFESLPDKRCNELSSSFENFYTNALNFHQKLINSGVCREQANLVLPFGILASWGWSVDALSIFKFIREMGSISPEFYGYAEALLDELRSRLPYLTAYFEKASPPIR